jgi:hypothetical protein
VFILKADKVLCFDTLLEVFILKGLRSQETCAKRGVDSKRLISLQKIAISRLEKEKAAVSLPPTKTRKFVQNGL